MVSGKRRISLKLMKNSVKKGSGMRDRKDTEQTKWRQDPQGHNSMVPKARRN